MSDYPPNVAGVSSITSGEGIIVNNADPANPIVGLISPVSAENGGTGSDSSAATGVAHVTDGEWSYSAVDLAADVTGELPAANGGTGGDSSAATGIAHVASGAWSYSAVGLASSDVTGTLPASKGGTGLSTSGTNASKYLKSNGSGGWVLETPAGGGTVTAVTAASPLESTGGTTPEISLGVVPLANTAAEIVTFGITAETEDVVSIKPSVGASQSLVMTDEVTSCAFDETELAALADDDKSVTVAVLVTNGTEAALDITPEADNWLGTAPTTVSVGATDAYLLVLTNFGTTVVGSWQSLS